MDYVELGRTGVKVSVAGLGTGGHSKLGLRTGGSPDSAIRIIHEAIGLGINVIDASDTAGMEAVVGRAISDRRDGVVLATKLHTERKDGSLIDGPALRSYVEGALTRLHTEAVDIFYLHGVAPEHYAYCVQELVPELKRLRERGLIRYCGATESWGYHVDADHKMLAQAVKDDHWDVLMTGFNILNQSAARQVFPGAIAKGIGIFAMYVVRDLLSRPDLLKEAIGEAVQQGLLKPEGIDLNDPLGFLMHEGGATSLMDAAYRFVRHTPGVHTVLTGTGNIEHLRANVASITRGPLPRQDLERLTRLFGHLTHLTGNAKGRYDNERKAARAM